MKPNTAVAFVLLGLATLLLNGRRETAAHAGRFCALLAGLLGVLTLAEYAFDWNPGIDHWVFREPPGAVGTAIPGRMAPETAMYFVLLAAAIIVCSAHRSSQRILLTAASASLLTTVLACAALLSYFTPALGPFGWWGQTIMAVPTAVTFGVLGAAALRRTLQRCGNFWVLNRAPTAAFGCGLVLLLLINLNTSRSQIQTAALSAQLSQSEQISAGFSIILAEVTRAQSHNRGYALTGEVRLLESLQDADRATQAAFEEQRSLLAVTRPDGPTFGQLKGQVDTALEWFHFTAESGLNARDSALRTQRVLQGEVLMDQLRSTFAQLEADEAHRRERLQAEAKSLGRKSFAILTSGTLLSAAIFFIALFRLNLAEAARSRAEMDLRVANQLLEKRVAERTAELARNKQLMDQAGRLARVGGWELDVVQNEVHWTDVVREIHEVEPQYVPTLDAGINFYAPASIPLIAGALQQAIATGKSFDLELQLVSAKGNRPWVRTIGEALRTDGKVTRLIGVFQDVTARRKAVEELRRQHDLLEAANRELEAFAYSVSHDLRAPLRSLDGFSRILLEDYRDKLDAEGQDSIARIRAAAQRMAQLIDDLLKLSRVTRTEMRREPVDLSQMAAEVIAELRRLEPDRRAEVLVAPGLIAQGDPRLLRIVLENLLGNAWGSRPHRVWRRHPRRLRSLFRAG